MMKAHGKYRSRGNSLARYVEVVARAEASAYAVQCALEPHVDHMAVALAETEKHATADAVHRFLRSDARSVRPLRWRLADHLAAIERPDMGGRMQPTGRAGLLGHVNLISVRYRETVDATKNRLAGGRKRKKALRKEADALLCRNLWALRCLELIEGNPAYRAELAAVAARAIG